MVDGKKSKKKKPASSKKTTAGKYDPLEAAMEPDATEPVVPEALPDAPTPEPSKPAPKAKQPPVPMTPAKPTPDLDIPNSPTGKYLVLETCKVSCYGNTTKICKDDVIDISGYGKRLFKSLLDQGLKVEAVKEG